MSEEEDLNNLLDLMSVYNPFSATIPALIGALTDSNKWRGGIIGLIIDKIFCIGYYWILKYDNPWKPEAKRPWWLVTGFLVELLITVGVTFYVRKKEEKL